MDECVKANVHFSSNLRRVERQRSATSVFRKWKRNKCRISRRKRKKVEHLTRRKELRIKRNNLNRLSFTVFDLTDMDCYAHPLQEVSEWSYRHELAYWKSRALTLQLENLKLSNMVHEIYKKDDRQYGLPESAYTNNIDNYEYDNDCGEGEEVEDTKGKRRSQRVYEETTFVEPPNKKDEEERRKQEQALYGSMAPKIKGMETAIRLNYDMYMERNEPSYWPNIPLNL